MIEKRAHFLAEYDWIRTGLMFEPRGHDMMSGAILYPPTRADCDVAILFIETSGCLPMCGHGTIGAVTMALEHGLVHAEEPGVLRLDTPAGLVVAEYRRTASMWGGAGSPMSHPSCIRRGLAVECPGLGGLVARRRLWRQFLCDRGAADEFQRHGRFFRCRQRQLSPGAAPRAERCRTTFEHPEKPEIRGLSPHPLDGGADAIRGPRHATRSSTATRRSTARPAAPAPRPAWRSGLRPAG